MLVIVIDKREYSIESLLVSQLVQEIKIIVTCSTYDVTQLRFYYISGKPSSNGRDKIKMNIFLHHLAIHKKFKLRNYSFLYNYNTKR